MTIFFSMLLASVPNVFLAILGKVVTQDFLQIVIEKVLIVTLDKAAKMTTNTVDDEIVALVAAKLYTKGA